jgi:hypothetical protein
VKFIFVVLCLIAIAFAQDAPVVELSSLDAATARELYAARQKAEKAWNDFKDHMVDKYLTLSEYASAGPLGSHWVRYREGFSGREFQFSKDMRFIVPHSYPPPANSPMGCVMNTPLSGCSVWGGETLGWIKADAH